MATITVKNIPDALYEQLKQTAQLHHRSINSEIIVCIEQMIGGQPIDLEMTLARAQVLREKTSAYPISDEAFTEVKTAGRA
jgi:plasmid stability protein